MLNRGNPLLITGDHIRMAPTADGLWVWVFDQSGNLYGLTIDPTVPAKALRMGQHLPAQERIPQ